MATGNAVPMQSFLAAQGDILEAIALGCDFADIADRLCRQTEALFAGAACSVTSVDREGLLHVLTAPSFPAIYREAIDGRLIGPAAGVCGAAAFRGGEIVVTDIAADPVFDDLRETLRDLPFCASWSCPITVEDGRVVAIFAVYFETARAPTDAERAFMRTSVDLCRIAFQQNEARRHIHRLAYTDVLTNLPNRFSFELFVSEALGETPARTVSIHCVDLNDFKTINDTLGHWGGDLLLAEVARRLMKACGETAYVARMAGDEFAICTAGTDAETPDTVAAAILSALDAPFEVAGQSLKVEANIGIVIAPEHGRDVEQLLQRADMALHEAKSAGRHTSRIFTEGMAEEMRRLTLLKADLGEALAKGQFHLEYQPIVDFSRCSVSAFEALLRWTHPVKGRIPPDLFIPIAEDMGLIQTIGLFVLDRAIEDAASWPADIAVAVNVSPLQLKSDRFATRMREALDRHGLPPERLIIEVTETALFDQGAATRQTLDEIVALGASIALDDFGTGYSSLSNLRDRRFSKIKIDKSFVLGIGSDAVCGAIVEGTIHFALKLGKRTTAEGIETPAQLAWLIRQGCDTGQGYLFSRPMPAEHVAPYLRTAPFAIAAASAEGLRPPASDCPLAALAFAG